jgi:lipopolysaccharide transport system permease protein
MRNLLLVMVKRDLLARHAGSVGGVAWVYMQPLIMVGAYYLVFDVVFKMRLGEGAASSSVGTFLIVGMVPWQAFCEALSRTTCCLVDAGPLLQKNALPPILVVLRSTLSTAFIYFPLFGLLAVLYTPMHNWTSPLWILPLLSVLQFIFAFLLGYSLSILAAAMRDVIPFVGFMLSIGVFVSPVLFPVSMFPPDWRWILYLNPMTAWIQAYQDVLLQGNWPSVASWVACAFWLSIALISIGCLVVNSKDELVDWL